ncbi:DUF4419 domain-containing protein [Mucilaginibacter dorajii]|uniref:DUF4419 domain-containing protein n=1 Tax=Mucilaginibacter dorajii TaxID=692994 RepID=A0ABP7P4W4_9SPHI|nr:DUF4419 domain-containing protein [Mucilaginibacter dorajii]MCS3734470.1 hypothetical protein [Mucilaginibacter dorajii]
MKFLSLLLLFLAAALTGVAQKSITIAVENLTKPTEPLRVKSYEEILKGLIREDNGISGYSQNTKHTDPSFNIVAKSKITDSLVSFGYHPFFEGMYNAYAQHRPFTLSPDMVWLLICQGFANHINNNADSLRHFFTDFKGKQALVVTNGSITLDNPNSPWEEIFPDFGNQIDEYTGKDLSDNLNANFSTTTPITKMASQITMMNAMKSYFDFVVIYIGCGIPKITLNGSPEDWKKVLEKTERLRKYKLDWWVDKMEPVLKQFVAASNGNVNKAFWQTMFKYHSKKDCGAPTIVDGWVVKFFPYNKMGHRNDLDSLSMMATLPDEIVKVDIDYKAADGNGNFVTTPLELWAGFVGLKQNKSDFMLKPEIGWMIRKKDNSADGATLSALKKGAESINKWGGITLNVKNFPPQLLSLGPIHFLTLYFTDQINIPDEIHNVKIDHLNLYGKVTNEEEKRIRDLFPATTTLFINSK